MVFMIIGGLMAIGGIWTLAWPLWRDGHRLMAALVGVFVLGLLAGLGYLLAA